MKLSETQFVMLDTETTNQDNPKVIEIAGLRWVHRRPISATDFKEDFVYPGEKITPSSMAVHHIIDEDVAGAPTMDEIDEEWGQWVGDDIIIAYNSDYDQGVLSNTSLHGKKWLDAYRMAMHFWSLGQTNEDGFPLTSLKQQELRYWLKLPKTSGDAHRAAADIQVTAYLVERVIDAYLECCLPDDVDAFVDYINGPVCHQTIPIGGAPFAGKTPDQIEDWAIKKAFDPSNSIFDAFKKFNIHECLLPEYIKRFGHEPRSMAKPTPAVSKPSGPKTSFQAPAKVASAPAPSEGGRKWARSR